jgi:hypothetical protein
LRDCIIFILSLDNEEILRLHDDYMARLQSQSRDDPVRLIREACRESGIKIAPEMEIGEALELIVRRGSPLARGRARGMLAHMNSAEQRAFARDFDAAVGLDPYWRKGSRGAWSQPGARHRTPDALVAAYRAPKRPA